jgi:hypothetical protein
MTLPWIIVICLYVAGSLCALGVSALLTALGGRSIRHREIGWVILWVLFWPFISPVFVTKVLVKLFRK